MLTINDLQSAFRIYYSELDKCRREHAWWAALHLALVVPDICSSLQNPGGLVGDRYVNWCADHFPQDGKMTPADRYQMRCTVLHQGSTLIQNKGKSHHSQYQSFSFVQPEDEPLGRDVHFVQDLRNKNITAYVQRIVVSTFDHAVPDWFKAVAADPVRNAAVASNLPTLIHLQGKELPITPGVQVPRFIVMSST
jgi:hypothetical protein